MAVPHPIARIRANLNGSATMSTNDTYHWERYPEYLALQQFSRCLGRVLASLPVRQRLRNGRILVPAAVFMAQGIAGAHADTGPEDALPPECRERFRQVGLESAQLSKVFLTHLKERRRVSRPDLLAALELLERVESGLATRPVPHP
jgi:hypothetical protein